jgi:hypothetical protein
MNLPKTVPLLPGFQFTDPLKQNFHKTQQFAVVNGTNCEKEKFIEEDVDYDLLASMKYNAPQNLTYGTKKEAVNDYIPRIPPSWLKYDRKVLRFNAYFQEHVVEDPSENYRLRKCLIYYYLDDNTLYITEPKIENSGIPQGVFLKRQMVPKTLEDRNDFITWRDINIGINLHVYGRVFRVVDCDEFTRVFYQENGVELNAPEQAPNDNFDYYTSIKDLKIPPPDTKEYKEYFEVKLKGGHPNGGLAKYLQNDRKVLSFDVVWNDTTLEGGLKLYTVNFFLADDTVEVKEVNEQNSGKDSFPLLLRRQKLPKEALLTHYPGMNLKKEEHYKALDFIIGNFVNIYNRPCLIYNCDEFTKKWFKEALGIDQVAIDLKKERPKKFWQPVPPYNGFGSEEDSLGSVYSLQPRPPRKDINKMFTCDQNILRYEARLISENKEDNTRTFIISFFCGDDTVQVYEKTERNSGVWAGKFLEKNKHKNPITNQYYSEKDFMLGNTVVLNQFRFQLLRCDEFTYRYLKEHPETFKEANIDKVLEKVRIAARKYKSPEDFAVNLFKRLDRNNSGYVEFEELYNGFKELDINLSIQEQYTIMRRFDSNGDFKLSMEELFNGLFSVGK